MAGDARDGGMDRKATQAPSPSPALAASARGTAHGIAVTRLESADGACATVADHGGHLLSWQPAGGGECLYLSPASGFGAGQAIRGGVPVIFPQFGERGRGRRHGVARTRPWEFQRTWQEDRAAFGAWQLRGLLERSQPDAGQPAADAMPFLLTLTVQVGGDSLCLTLDIENTGSQPWQCHAALHTYLQVADLQGVTIDGLQQAPYIDNAAPQEPAACGVAGDRTCPGEPGPLRFAREIDRLYPGAPARLILADGAAHLTLTQEGFADTVVWNPGAVKGAALADLPPGGQAHFVCIEAAAVLHPVLLAPGASWSGRQHFQVGRPGQ